MTLRVTRDEYLVLIGQKKPEPRVKNAQRVETADGKFDSKREANRWDQLVLEKKAGRITKLRRQVKFSISWQGEHICFYIADFVYERNSERVVEDAKGHRTEVYIIKRKLMLICLGIQIQEV